MVDYHSDSKYLPFPQQVPQKSNLEAMMESMLLVQQKQNEYIKQLASKVDVLSTYNKILETQIVQQVGSSSRPPGDFLANLSRTLGSNVMQWFEEGKGN